MTTVWWLIAAALTVFAAFYAVVFWFGWHLAQYRAERLADVGDAPAHGEVRYEPWEEDAA